MVSHEIVSYPQSLVSGRSSRTDWYFREYLTGIRIDDWYVEVFGDVQCRFGLAYSCRACNDDESLFFQDADASPGSPSKGGWGRW